MKKKKDKKIEEENKSVKKSKNAENTEKAPSSATSEEKVSEIDSIKQLLEISKTEAQGNQDKFLRLNAEFINFKKRMERDKLEFLKYANSNILKTLFPFIDSFEHALKAHPEDEGLTKLFDSLLDILKKEGLEKIQAVGEKFDHDLHDAIGFDKNENFKDDYITLEMQTGYKLKNKVLRHSMVKVNKK
ncbi:MAG: nucleotide exchange factor GrpE [bacterium]|nr:nucleotide exchange factor GrpE [bacterium]